MTMRLPPILLPLVAATLLTACVHAQPSYGERMDRHERNDRYDRPDRNESYDRNDRGGDRFGERRVVPAGPVVGVPPGVQITQPGSYGGPPPRPGVETVPRVPAGMNIHPTQGQSRDRMRSDERLCANMAAGEPQSATDLGHYERAVAICLEGRGYRLR
jgi:hypothetical protein